MEGYEYDFDLPTYQLTPEVMEELEYMPALPSYEIDPEDDIPY